MTRTLTTTIAALAALAWLPPSTSTAVAQETTAQEVLEALRLGELPESAPRWMDIDAPATWFLRQVDPSSIMCTEGEDRCRFEPAPRTAAELDAFADRVAAVAADATLPDDVRREARFALAGAASRSEVRRNVGTPYPRASDLLFDLLVRIYESGNEDDALSSIVWADSLRGLAYVRDVFERSERPPVCGWSYESRSNPPWSYGYESRSDQPYPEFPWVRVRDEPPQCEGKDRYAKFHETPWCHAGYVLYEEIVAEAWASTPGGRPPEFAGYPLAVPEGLPEHVEDWHRRCR